MSAKLAVGTTPRQAQGEVQASAWVQKMFARIAPKYDLLNHLLSFNIDRGWRRLLRAELQPILTRHRANVLDLCCGTGDVLLELQRGSQARVLGADFCHPMLVEAHQKIAGRRLRNELVEADALALPLADRSLDAIAISFGYRNLANYRGGLREFHRVLRPGGTLAILEFSHPPNPVIRWLYGLYSRYVLPVIGGLISGSREAYTYLPESISKFPTAPALAQMMVDAEFSGVRFQRLSAGIAALHIGRKA